MNRAIFSIALCTVAIVTTHNTAIGELSFEGCGTINGFTSPQGLAVSGDGSTLVGTFLNGPNQHAFKWTHATGMMDLGVLDGFTSSAAYGVSFDGSIVVGSSQSQNSNRRAVRVTGSTMMNLDPTGNYPYSWAYDVSADGQIVAGNSPSNPFIWNAQTGFTNLSQPPGLGPATLTALSDNGQRATGIALDNQGRRRAVLWQDTVAQSLGVPIGFVESEAFDISADGSTIVGRLTPVSGARAAFRWSLSTGFENLGTIPGGGDMVAFGVSADGSTVAGNGITIEGNRALLWTAQSGMQDLNTLLAPVLPSGWKLLSVRRISNDGLTVGGWGTHNGVWEPWVAHVPEPSSIGLAMICSTALLGIRNRRRRCFQ